MSRQLTIPAGFGRAGQLAGLSPKKSVLRSPVGKEKKEIEDVDDAILVHICRTTGFPPVSQQLKKIQDIHDTIEVDVANGNAWIKMDETVTRAHEDIQPLIAVPITYKGP